MGWRSERAGWAADVARPVPLVAAAVLAVNDHVLKGAGVLPGAVTGKLSDVAGLLVAGIVAVALARGAAAGLTGRRSRRDGRLPRRDGRLPRRDGRLAVGALAAVGVGFAALKLWPGFNQVVERVWGVNVLDPTDLWALVMLPVAWLWLRDREEAVRVAAGGDVRDADRMSGNRTVWRFDGAGWPRRFVTGLAWLAVLLACAATPRPPPVPPPPVPGWDVGHARMELPCGEATAWVSKSGKAGAGLTVRVTWPADVEACDVRVVAARLRFADAVVDGREVLLAQPTTPSAESDRHRHEALVEAAPGRTRYHYLGFVFDNQDRWNRGERSGVFELELQLGGERRTWTMPAQHAYQHFPPAYPESYR